MLTDISARSVSYRIPNGRLLFDDFETTICCGEAVAVTGPSGVGKSSLLRLLGALIVPDSGEIVVGSNRHYRPISLDDVAWIFQDNWCLEERSLEENVAQPLLAVGMSSSAIRSRVSGAVRLVEMIPHLRTKARRLSGGERQRMCVARAVASPARIVLADEPTAHLDRRNSDIVAMCLSRVAQSGKTLIVATHDQDLAARCARKIVL